MSSLSPADLVDERYNLCYYQGAANKMVSGHLFAHAEKNQRVSAAIEAGYWRQL